MGIRMDKRLDEMSLAELTRCCAQEMSKYRRKEISSDQYCLEILRRAVVLRDDQAWAVLQQQFNENIRLWLARHPYRETALRYEVDQSYIDDAFRRFWQAIKDQHLIFATLASALSYLHLCLNCAIMDTLRAYSRPKEEPIPEYMQGNFEGPGIEDRYHEEELWEVIESLLPGEKEKRLAYLLFYCTSSRERSCAIVLPNLVVKKRFIASSVILWSVFYVMSIRSAGDLMVASKAIEGIALNTALP